MIRLAYQCLVYLLAPGVFLVFLWRGLRDRGYWRGLPERLGFGRGFSRPVIWVHAVSVGEVQAAIPLLQGLAARYPDEVLLLTTATPTGRARAQATLGERVHLRYLPIDLPGAVARFFDRVRPRIAIIIEKELWPNLYRECGLRGVPLVLASATVSPLSVKHYRRLSVLFRETLSHGMLIAAQSEEDAGRFRAIGAPPERTHVVGNLKFDRVPPSEVRASGAAWRKHYGAETRQVIVAGSTHAAEEQAMLAAYRELRAAGLDLLLVLAPRHPARFAAVAQELRRAGVVWVRHAEARVLPNSAPEVLLLDTLGDLAGFYAAADVAFVGGSLLTGVGGHNPLEPAALGVPVLMGPHTFNAKEMVRELSAAGALQQVDSAGQLGRALQTLLQDDTLRLQRGRQALAVVERNRGALVRLMALIEPLLMTEASAARPSCPDPALARSATKH